MTLSPHPSASIVRFLLATILLCGASAAAAKPRVWFVDNMSTNGHGSAGSPFASIGAATAIAGEGDVIYVFRGSGTYRERVILGARQLLVGHGFDVRQQLEAHGIVVPADLPSLAAPPTIDGEEGDAVVLATGSSVAGLKLRTTSGRALSVMNAGGEIAITDVVIETAKGIAMAVDGGDANIDVTRSPVTAAAGSALIVSNRVGGALRFGEGSTITVTAATSDAVVLEKNQGEYSFSEPLRLTTAGARALVIRSSSRVTMSSGESMIATTRAAAVDVADTGISIYLKSVSVDGAGATVARGISIENASGTFRLDGGMIRNIASRGISIARAEGVTLQNLVLEKNAASVKATPACSNLTEEKDLDCRASIHLVDAGDVLLRQVKIDDSGQAGIFGDRVRNLTLDHVTMEDAGDEPGEHGIVIRGLYGRSVILESTVKDSAARQLFVLNRDGEGALEIRKSSFDGGPPPAGQQGVLVQLEKEARFSLAVDDSDFVQHFSNAIHVSARDTSQLELFVNNSRFSAIASAVNAAVEGEARLQYRIVGNRVRGATGPAINVNIGVAAGASSGTIAGNVIGESGKAGSGAKCGSCSGITVIATRGGSIETTIRDNTIREVDGYGIRINARGRSNVAAVVTGNNIADPHGADVLSAIALQSGVVSADTARLCVDVDANRITGAWDPQGGGTAIASASRGNAVVAFAGMAEGTNAAAAAEHLGMRNNGAKAKVTGSIAAAKSCF